MADLVEMIKSNIKSHSLMIDYLMDNFYETNSIKN
jgi:hypothetical protein